MGLPVIIIIRKHAASPYFACSDLQTVHTYGHRKSVLVLSYHGSCQYCRGFPQLCWACTTIDCVSGSGGGPRRRLWIARAWRCAGQCRRACLRRSLSPSCPEAAGLLPHSGNARHGSERCLRPNKKCENKYEKFRKSTKKWQVWKIQKNMKKWQIWKT